MATDDQVIALLTEIRDHLKAPPANRYKAVDDLLRLVRDGVPRNYVVRMPGGSHREVDLLVSDLAEAIHKERGER